MSPTASLGLHHRRSRLSTAAAALSLLMLAAGARAFLTHAPAARLVAAAASRRATLVTSAASASLSSQQQAHPRSAAAASAPAFFASAHRRQQVRMMASAGGASNDRLKVRAAHILVKTEAQADELLARLDGGADFGEVAMVESECPSKQQGGDLGWFGAGQMVPEFEQACFTNPTGARVKVQTQFGWHVIQVVSKARAPGDMHPQQLQELLANPSEKAEYQLIDVREPDEIATADIPGGGFMNLPLSQFPQWGPKILNGELLDKGKKTLVLCHHGGRSMQVASFLASQAGFENVINASGGIHMYAEMCDNSIPRY